MLGGWEVGRNFEKGNKNQFPNSRSKKTSAAETKKIGFFAQILLKNGIQPKRGMKNEKVTAFLFAAVLSFAFLVAPAILESRGGHGGHGGGHHGGHHGIFHGGIRRGPIYYGAPGFGAGFLAGYWSNGYYYTYPYNGVCERWVPTGGEHMESRQDPDTDVWYTIQVPDGYWEDVPCN